MAITQKILPSFSPYHTKKRPFSLADKTSSYTFNTYFSFSKQACTYFISQKLVSQQIISTFKAVMTFDVPLKSHRYRSSITNMPLIKRLANNGSCTSSLYTTQCLHALLICFSLPFISPWLIHKEVKVLSHVPHDNCFYVKIKISDGL